jgi:thiosulfate reductase/polysulfide reductase chain A
MHIALCVEEGGEKDMKKRMFVWVLSVVFVFSMLSLTFAQGQKPAGPPPVPKWEEPLVSPDPRDPYSFRLIHGKQSIHTHSMTANQPYLMAISHRYDMIRLWMNRSRGRQLGLEDGDWVRMKSMVGEGRIRVRLTEGLHPSCVWLPSGYGIFSKDLKTAYDMGLSYNDFLPTYFDPTVGHSMSSEIVVQVVKA